MTTAPPSTRLPAAAFTPAWWCRGPHLQTLWPALCRHRPALPWQRERLELPDGDFLDLDWLNPEPGHHAPQVLLLHGLQGSSRSHYLPGLLETLNQAGWQGAVMHFRGCSGSPNRLARGYHSGDTADLEYVVGQLRARAPQAPLAVIGFSLGGNVLLKWLAERGASAPVVGAVAVSVPYQLDQATARMHRGRSRLYEWYLLRALKQAYRDKFRGRPAEAPVPLDQLRRIASIRDFDEYITAPLHGFRGADDYYRQSSAGPLLGSIRTPTLLVQALDDPFMYPHTAPPIDKLPACVTAEWYDHGGHVGFVAGRWPWRAEYWLDGRIGRWLADLTPKPGRGCLSARIAG